MKYTFEVMNYYKKNKKISKLHGVLFMLVGWVVLGYLVYELFLFSTNISNVYADLDSEIGSGCSRYNLSSMAVLNSKLTIPFSRFDSVKQDYEQLKISYSATSNVDQKVNLFNKLGDKISELIDIYNEAIPHYNSNAAYYEDCSGITTSFKLDSMQAYIDQQSLEHDAAFKILEPLAEAEGYYFYG